MLFLTIALQGAALEFCYAAFHKKHRKLSRYAI